MLHIEDLTVQFRGPAETVTALDRVSLTLAAGEFVAVLGPSGCGKTTLLLVAGALLRPTSGAVEIGGEAPYTLSPERRCAFRAAHIGFVFQQFHLIPYLSVYENILSPTVALSRPDAATRAQALMSQFQLEPRKNHVPAMLSTGEKQRTALARALLHDPDLILADEPTGNLDKENSAIVLDHLKNLAEQGKGVLMVTHDEAARNQTSRALHLDNGRLVPE
jgi:putative ABC transport system ATP-binding protein